MERTVKNTTKPNEVKISNLNCTELIRARSLAADALNKRSSVNLVSLWGPLRCLARWDREGLAEQPGWVRSEVGWERGRVKQEKQPWKSFLGTV